MLEYKGQKKSISEWARQYGLKPATLGYRVKIGVSESHLMIPANSVPSRRYFDKSIEELFESNYIPEPNSGCWLWTGSINMYGYGVIQFHKKLLSAHRLSYEINIGKIPHGMQIDHLCRVRCCVNPKHLEAVTSGENTRRGLAAANYEKPHTRKAHCPKGHPYSGENLYVNPKGFKECRICKRLRRQAYR